MSTRPAPNPTSANLVYRMEQAGSRRDGGSGQPASWPGSPTPGAKASPQSWLWRIEPTTINVFAGGDGRCQRYLAGAGRDRRRPADRRQRDPEGGSAVRGHPRRGGPPGLDRSSDSPCDLCPAPVLGPLSSVGGAFLFTGPSNSRRKTQRGPLSFPIPTGVEVSAGPPRFTT